MNGDVMTELKSLKNPTRLLTVLMFVSFVIYTIGIDTLRQILPFVPETFLTVIMAAATYIVIQFGTEKRVVRAEELKDEEYLDSDTNSILDDVDSEIDEDGI